MAGRQQEQLLAALTLEVVVALPSPHEDQGALGIEVLAALGVTGWARDV